MQMNEVLEKLPAHLMDLVIEQPYNEYTPQDHAVWRYVMRQNVRYLSRVAHGSYVEGLRRTGISIDEIPHMYGMNRILKEIGWAAVAVDGFIPPSAFMEFQAYQVLVIAADIRPIDQIGYTPAPDIIHEAAGHAPIIADPEYAGYLKYFGMIGHKAFSSRRDYELYEAIRHLSILKADPYSSPLEIQQASEHLGFLERNMGAASEMARIRNLHWWTVEYGLIGTIDDPRIYGAGLLSSIGESVNALSDNVKRIPYNLSAAEVGFDITTMQPQLFVTPDFPYLNQVLEAFADTMALRRGGAYGLRQAIDSGNGATLVYSSGLQVCGVFSEGIMEGDDLIYLQTSSPSILCHKDKVLDGHGLSAHAHGFGSPAGPWEGVDGDPEDLDEGMLSDLGLFPSNPAQLRFRSGVVVEGRVAGMRFAEGKLLLITWHECTVTYQGRLLFNPAWGVYDMAVGAKVVSAYTGPADPLAFGLNYQAPQEKTHKIQHTEDAKALHALYREIRRLRAGDRVNGEAATLWKELISRHPADWLAPLELLEITRRFPSQQGLNDELYAHLNTLRQSRPELGKLIEDGLALLD
ncbi:MAG TPA: aromatic amino acid hydroxylase [Bacteroidales bacterium]|nr:aromatic amino acid hydroxylase [Bacteroidales bacterium]HRZ75726.1 aromatic amino acid hydroxylase [Bacteroidales bacterium]